VLQTILRSYLVQSVNVNSVGIQPADVVIEPDVSDVDLSDFSRTKELGVTGEEATLRVIPKINSLLTQLDPQLFPSHKQDD
jgi:NTE family protein